MVWKKVLKRVQNLFAFLLTSPLMLELGYIYIYNIYIVTNCVHKSLTLDSFFSPPSCPPSLPQPPSFLPSVYLPYLFENIMSLFLSTSRFRLFFPSLSYWFNFNFWICRIFTCFKKSKFFFLLSHTKGNILNMFVTFLIECYLLAITPYQFIEISTFLFTAICYCIMWIDLSTKFLCLDISVLCNYK